MAKFRFATNGFSTVMELDGKTIGNGVEKVEFCHVAGESAKLKVDIDVRDFKFLKDGEYEKLEAVLIGKMNQSDEKKEDA